MDKIIIKKPAEIIIMREAGRRLASIVEKLKVATVAGISTLDLDILAEKLIRSNGDIPAFKGYRKYPASLCVSLNDEVVHGIPSSDRIIKSGDIVSLDIGLIHQGFYSDMATTVAVDQISAAAEDLLRTTEDSLMLAIDQAKAGAHLGVISNTVQRFVENKGFGVVRDLVGHGIGQTLHEDPPVPNFGSKSSGPRLVKGMTLAIEPMVTMGDYHVTEDADKWTIRTEDGSLSAHFEHTIVITDHEAEILTLI